MSHSLKVAGLAAIATAAMIYASFSQGRTAHATRALDLLPSTARGVLRIDSRSLLRSAAAQMLLDAFVREEQLSEIEATCGLDPIADLAELTLWVRGSVEKPFESFGLMLTGGRVDATEIATCYEALVEARGGSVIRLDAPSGPLLASEERGSAIALVDARTVVTGGVRTVAEAMAARRGLLPTLAERAPVASLWLSVSPGAAIAAALEPPSHWKAALERVTTFDAASALHGIDAIGLAVRPGKAHRAEVHLQATTPDLATQSAALIRRMAEAPPDAMEPPWDELLRTGEVAVDGRHIVVAVDVSSLSPDR